jgi:hypothetical protein
MRCGPAFGLDGLISGGSQTLNRVVIDGLAVKPTNSQRCEPLHPGGLDNLNNLSGASVAGFSACLQAGTGLLVLHLEQSFAQDAGRKDQHISQKLLVQAPI